MEQTTLQQRIEERAKDKLEKDLVALSNSIAENRLLSVYNDNSFPKVTEEYRNLPDLLKAHYYTPSYQMSGKGSIQIKGDYSKKLYDYWLPIYIQEVTDEILHKIDEIDYLLDNKQVETQDY